MSSGPQAQVATPTRSARTGYTSGPATLPTEDRRVGTPQGTHESRGRTRERTARVAVVGADRFSMDMLATIGWKSCIEFLPLLDIDAVRPPGDRAPDFFELLAEAERRLRELGGAVDGVIGWWDFPTTGLVPVLQHRLGLPGADPRTVAALEHKLWSRVEQSAVIPEMVPRFSVLDPFAADPDQVDFPLPFWIKPIKSHSSHLGFRIDDRQELRRVLEIIRTGIGRFGHPFDQFLSLVDPPESVAQVTGHHCLIEEIISSGHQCTLEGYAYDGEVLVYGVVDSIRSGRHGSCFSRYEYPSRVPAEVQSRMAAATRAVIGHVGYDGAPFNAEFYWDEETDDLRLLEVNCRISKSHCPLFWMVDGASHQQVLVQLALGLQPVFPHRVGRHGVAAKFMIRSYEDGVIERLPGMADLARLADRFPDARFTALVEEGTRLAHLPYQDSYSFEVADLFLGAGDQRALLRRFEVARRMLPLRIRAIAGEQA